MTSRKGKLQHLSSPAIQLESYCFVLKLVDPAQHVWQSSYSASCNLPKISSSSSSLLVPPLLCRPGGVCCMSEMASLEWGKMAQRMKEAVCIHTTTESETEGQGPGETAAAVYQSQADTLVVDITTDSQHCSMLYYPTYSIKIKQ